MTPPYADLIGSAMRAKDLSVTDLARQIGKSRQWTAGLVAGKWTKPPSDPATIRAIAQALDLDEDELYASVGRIPPDIKATITTSQWTIKAARQAIGRVLKKGGGK